MVARENTCRYEYRRHDQYDGYLADIREIGRSSIASGRKLDGVDIWPVMAGAPAAQPPRDQFLYYRGLKLEAVRSGPWKLHLAVAPANNEKKSGAETRLQLFNVVEDLAEAHDVAKQHPEIVEKLKAIAEATEGDLGKLEVGPGCRSLGRVRMPTFDQS